MSEHFFHFQGEGGDIIDGYMDIRKANLNDPEATVIVCLKPVHSMLLIKIQ